MEPVLIKPLKHQAGSWLTGPLALPVSKEGHFLEGSENLRYLGSLEKRGTHLSLQVLQVRWQILSLDFQPQEAFKSAVLVAQWMRIHLPVQGAQARSLVLEDGTWRRATETHAPQLLSPCCRACGQLPSTRAHLLTPMCLEPCSTARGATSARTHAS